MFRRLKPNTGWVWPDTFPAPPEAVKQIMDQLTRLSPAEAEKILIRVVRECRECGIGVDIALPRERRFIERQYTRAVAALAEIVEKGPEDDPRVGTAQKVLETNRGAEEQHDQGVGEWTRPEVDEWVAEHWGQESGEAGH